MGKKWFVGIDISKMTLDCRVYCTENLKPENYLRVTNDMVGFKRLLKWFKSRKMQLAEIAVCMEHTGIYGLAASLLCARKGV
jgi:transposase